MQLAFPVLSHLSPERQGPAQPELEPAMLFLVLKAQPELEPALLFLVFEAQSSHPVTSEVAHLFPL